ncbi:unnamed protein product [Adineta steineri]|uniref:ATP-grasp domain-containing protein n=1 Tax=Adineta steineri TaxID=433720 RepID=A0A813QBL7_9BILA|nr:unnamed protein product [Adineta steineri]
METSKKRAKIYKVFYDEEVIDQCPEYEMVFSEQKPHPEYSRLANDAAKDTSMEYMRNLITSVETYLKKNIADINGLFIKHDIEAVIISAVLSRFKRDEKLAVKYPSYESVFLCNHKYYQRTRERHPLHFSYINIDNDDDVDQFIRNPILKYPFFLKALELQRSLHQYIIKDCQQLKEIVSELRIVLPNYNAEKKYVNEYALDLQKYPLTSKNIMICEEFISDCLQLNWEGWADHQGTIFTYGFTDEILQDISFKSSFVNIELWIRKTNYDDIRIIEVNPRIASSYQNQYRSSYRGANLYHSIIKLSMGHTDIGVIPNIQTNFTGLYSCQSVIGTRCDGQNRTRKTN